MVRFVIPYPDTKKGKAEWNRRFGLNAYWSGKHWTKRREDAEYWHLLCNAEMNRQNVQRTPFESPVEIAIFFNDRLDVDNHSAMAKMIVDSMKGRVIEDDSRKYVKRLTQEFHDEECILVEVLAYGEKETDVA